jgi:hypothetical protein
VCIYVCVCVCVTTVGSVHGDVYSDVSSLIIFLWESVREQKDGKNKHFPTSASIDERDELNHVQIS